MLIASVNQDRGVAPGRSKGASVHVQAMRDAFTAQGARVVPVDGLDDEGTTATLAGLDGLDLVYERYALGAGAAGVHALSRGVAHVMEVNAPLLDEAARHRGLTVGEAERRREAEVLRRPARLLAVSHEVARWLVEQGVDEARVLVRPNAVDPARFHPGLRGPPGDDVVLGFHGRLRPWHGFEMLVRLMERLLDRGLPVRLEVVGHGDYEASLAGRLPPDRWSVTPWVPHGEVGRHVARFDLLALTYPPDAPCYFSPLKLLEAMATGAVPVVPDLSDLPGVVRHDVDGVVYPAGDLGALEDAVAALVEDPERRARLGLAAATTAAGRTWAAIAAEVMAFARTSGAAAP